MFYFTDFVYQELYAFGFFGGVEGGGVAENSCDLLYSNVTVLYTSEICIWNSLHAPLPGIPSHTTANTLNAFPPGGFCKLQKHKQHIDVTSTYNPSNKSCFLRTIQ